MTTEETPTQCAIIEPLKAHALECPCSDETTRRGRTCICKAIGVYGLARRMAPDWSKP